MEYMSRNEQEMALRPNWGCCGYSIGSQCALCTGPGIGTGMMIPGEKIGSKKVIGSVTVPCIL